MTISLGKRCVFDQIIKTTKAISSLIYNIVLFIYRESSQYRLKVALRVLESDFLLVGMTENIPEFMEALDYLLPHFFRGAKQIFEEESK